MGGDDAPEAIVAGAKRAVAELGLDILLVGQPDAIAACDPGPIEVLGCSEVITMHDDPGTSVRRKKDSSMVRAAEAVRDGRASAMVSAGNTGAAMASALLRMGRIKGIARPAIATPIPTPGSTPTILLDAGANAECQAPWLVQFAQMGAVFAETGYGIVEPRVGLLSIGEEDSKGTPLVKEANTLLSETKGLNFIGNVEGRDLMTDAVDVVVTDGFTGNVALKTLEGGLYCLQSAMIDAMTATEELKTDFAKVWPALERVIDDLHPENRGGAMLLGVNGVCIISHGSSSEKAVLSAIRIAQEMVERNFVEHLASIAG